MAVCCGEINVFATLGIRHDYLAPLPLDVSKVAAALYINADQNPSTPSTHTHTHNHKNKNNGRAVEIDANPAARAASLFFEKEIYALCFYTTSFFLPF